LASRRRRRKSIGKVITDVERRVRRVEKRPGPTSLKRNVVTGEKIQYRTIASKAIEANAVTANEAAFGVPVVSDTEPSSNLKAGTIWVNPDDGSAAAYDYENSTFVPITDVNAQASADGKNTIYRQTTQPTGASYVTGDTWFDEDDDNKIYRYNGSSWVGLQLGGNGLANISANSINTGTLNASLVTVSNLDAGNITTGTLTGRTVQTSSSGQRVLLSGANNALQFTNPSGTVVSNITPMTRSGSIYGMNIHAGSTPDTGSLSNAGVIVQDGLVGMYANAAAVTLQNGNVQISAGVFPSSASITLYSTSVLIDKLDGQALAADPTSAWVVRNIKATATAGTPSGGGLGDIVLVWA
jgi:hypothetical protein